MLFSLALHSEWISNIQRDTYASYVGHPPLLEYFSVATDEPMAKLRTRFIEVSRIGGRWKLSREQGLMMGLILTTEYDTACRKTSRKGGLRNKQGRLRRRGRWKGRGSEASGTVCCGDLCWDEAILWRVG